MTPTRTSIALLVIAALSPMAVTSSHAQVAPPPPAAAQAPQRMFSQAELDQMLAPIALYPDALLSQILMAATYPIEVVEAARWTRANPGLRGDTAVRAVQDEDWDPSVKSLVAFPQVLQRMDEQLKWTEALGDAFLAQEPAVMDTVQQLRRRAHAAGNLQSTEQVRVVQQGQTIVVQSPPEVVYVPYYDPLVVYGTWWWPAYRPVVWAPWPGYTRHGVSVGFWWGSPVSVSLSFFFGDCDWGRRRVYVPRPTAYYYRPPTVVVNRTTVINRNVTVERNTWQHDPHHRRGVAYRAPEVRARFADAQPANREAQREGRRDERGMERRAPERRAPAAQPAPQTATPQTATPQTATPQTKPETRTEAQKEIRRQDTNRARREAQEQARKERAAQREAQRQAEPRPQPRAQPAQRQAEPQPQAQPAQRQAEPRPQPQAQPAQRQAEPRPQPQLRQERNDERREERQQERREQQGRRGGQGGGDRS